MAKPPEDHHDDDRNAEPDADYEVGHGKPPKSARFAPGQSGNPKGRPRGHQSLDTLLCQELRKSIPVREGGKVRTMSKRAALIKRLVNKAIDGDPRATSVLLSLSHRIEMDRAARDMIRTSSKPDDDELINDFLARRLASNNADNQ